MGLLLGVVFGKTSASVGSRIGVLERQRHGEGGALAKLPSATISPPWRSTIFWHSANPIPVPGYSSRPFSRSNTRKIRALYRGSKPMPLSATTSWATHRSPLR